MTSRRGSCSAMARRLLAFLALLAVGDCLICNVCIPPLVGDPKSKKQAEQWRAKISRTFDNKAEDDFQVCGEEFDMAKEGEASCPWDTDDVVCLGINYGSAWTALTCGKVPVDTSLSCDEQHLADTGELICPCPFSNCNSRGWRDATASLALIAALLGTALAAAW